MESQGTDSSLRRFVVVSGMAASGKSTLGKRLATSLNLAFIDKDDYLEPMFDECLPKSREDKLVLSRRADEVFMDAVRVSAGAVVTSFWRRPEMGHEFGTPFEWIGDLPSSWIREVHCVCPPEEAVRRFVERVRHPGHHDIREATRDAVERFGQTAALGPLGIGEPLIVDTSRPIADKELQQVVSALLASL